MWIKIAGVGLCVLCFTVACRAQALKVERTWQGDKLAFTVTGEKNIFNYAVEGADDTLQFEIIGAIKAKGYSLTTVYYEFINYDYTYRYYRVKQIDMNGSCIMEMLNLSAKNDLPLQVRSLMFKDTLGDW